MRPRILGLRGSRSKELDLRSPGGAGFLSPSKRKTPDVESATVSSRGAPQRFQSPRESIWHRPSTVAGERGTAREPPQPDSRPPFARPSSERAALPPAPGSACQGGGKEAAGSLAARRLSRDPGESWAEEGEVAKPTRERVSLEAAREPPGTSPTVFGSEVRGSRRPRQATWAAGSALECKRGRA